MPFIFKAQCQISGYSRIQLWGSPAQSLHWWFRPSTTNAFTLSRSCLVLLMQEVFQISDSGRWTVNAWVSWYTRPMIYPGLDEMIFNTYATLSIMQGSALEATRMKWCSRFSVNSHRESGSVETSEVQIIQPSSGLGLEDWQTSSAGKDHSLSSSRKPPCPECWLERLWRKAREQQGGVGL